MSHRRKNSVTDKVIGKKQIYSDIERSPLHRQSVGLRRGGMRQQNLVWLVFIGWVISYANEWEDYSNYFGEGVQISRIWSTAHSRSFNSGPVVAPLGVSFHLLRIKVWSCLPAWSHLIPIGLCCVLGLCHSFKSCALPLSLLLQRHRESPNVML